MSRATGFRFPGWRLPKGTSTSGYGGTSTSGDGGTSTSGDGGTIEIRWWDSTHQRYRTEIGYVGEDGIEANVAYRLDDAHRFVAVKSPAKVSAP